MEHPGTPSPRRVPERGTLALLLACMALSFCLWFGGGWLLAAQLSPPADPPLEADMRPLDWRNADFKQGAPGDELDARLDGFLPR